MDAPLRLYREDSPNNPLQHQTDGRSQNIALAADDLGIGLVNRDRPGDNTRKWGRGTIPGGIFVSAGGFRGFEHCRERLERCRWSCGTRGA